MAAVKTQGGKAALVTGPGADGGQVQVLDPMNHAAIDTFFTQGQGGMFVAASPG